MFVPGKPFQLSLMFVGNLVWSTRKGLHSVSSSLTHNHQTRLEKFARDTLAYFRTFVNYRRKKCSNIEPRGFIQVCREAALRQNCKLEQKCFMRLVQEENWFKKCLNDSLSCSMDKLKLTGQNLVRLGCDCISLYKPCNCTHNKAAQLKVENSARTTFRFSPVSFRAPPLFPWDFESFHLSLFQWQHSLLDQCFSFTAGKVVSEKRERKKIEWQNLTRKLSRSWNYSLIETLGGVR